ncbi:MFS transporter [Paenibacillus baekrokdamisoli]|uniref:MFS transporter n=1 Tax=Paenibacillus baekrokdamisoli TaxID=1712516 RepID=A0A3G9JQ11_9BACL|nr:MFS transporter [Paenibacillus baekrokdamisoli]MBB3069502.1 YQGE family putative transporter [Paenibacillus baekrokdamisoli]BBH24924.1 MFS transporter [Paenibacillus baekrokdamisoli]
MKHERLNGRQLDRQAILLLAVQGLLGIANALSGTFLPIYLWKASQSLALIGWFNLSQFAVSGLTFWLAGKWVKEHNKMNSLRLGVALSGVFYFVVLLLGKSAVTYAVPLGMFNGLSLGLFWVAFNVVYFEITEPGNRDRFNGWAGLLGSGAGIIAPWVSGLLITASKGERGYSIIFTISAIIFAIAAVLSFWLKRRESSGHYEWFHGIRQLRQPGNPWRQAVPALMAQGVREGVFMFLVGLLVYMATSNEQKLGNFSLITSLVALVSFWIIGKLLTPPRRNRAMMVGAFAITLVIVPLFMPLRYETLLWFGIGTALFIPLYIIPMTSTVFDLIGSNEQSAKQREEFIVLREAALTVGRILGISAYLVVLPFVDQAPQTVAWLMLAVGAFPIISWWLMRRFLGTGERQAM